MNEDYSPIIHAIHRAVGYIIAFYALVLVGAIGACYLWFK